MEQTEIHLRTAKHEYATLLLVCLAGIGIIIYLGVGDQQLLFTMVNGLLLGSGIVYSIAKLYQSAPEYILTQTGIQFGLHLGGHFIPWTDIEAMNDERLLDGPAYVQLRLKADSPYWLTMSPLRKQLLRIHACGRELIPVARFHTAGLTLSHQQILVILQDYFQKYQKANFPDSLRRDEDVT